MAPVRATFLALVGAATVLALTGCGGPGAPDAALGGSQQSGTVSQPVTQSAPPRAGSGSDGGLVTDPGEVAQAVDLLDTLAVAPRDPWNNYSRAEFGEEWADLDGDGCNTRNEVLARDLTDVTTARDGCVVLTGVLHDPYSGAVVDFQRGADTSPLVQIDHVVSLSNAWRTGAQHWSAGQRLQFANDPGNLLAVSAQSNADKDNDDASSWSPPDAAARCPFAVRVVEVKSRYGLWVTSAEHDALARALSACAEATSH